MEIFNKSLHYGLIGFIFGLIIIISICTKGLPDKLKQRSRLSIIFSIIFLIISCGIFPVLDLLFCIDLKTSKVITKNITFNQLDIDYLRPYSIITPGRNSHKRAKVFKLITSNGEKFYICNEQAEKSIKSIKEDFHMEPNSEINYVETYRGNFIINLDYKTLIS